MPVGPGSLWLWPSGGGGRDTEGWPVSLECKPQYWQHLRVEAHEDDPMGMPCWPETDAAGDSPSPGCVGLDHSSDERLVSWMNEFKESEFAKNSKR